MGCAASQDSVQGDQQAKKWGKVQTGKDGEAIDLDIEDTNMAGVGTSLDHAVRKGAAETEKAWKAAGLPPTSADPAIRIWRIEQFHVVAVKPKHYGTFYNGDSYIVLHTYKLFDSEKLHFDLHYWIGSKSTQDEYGSVAYKTVELDDLLDQVPVQHRECEKRESRLFKSYFKETGFKVLEGGVATGFRHAEPDKYEPRLLWVRKSTETNGIRIIEVPLKPDSLNEGDCFVLDLGTKIYVWEGQQAAQIEKFSAATEGRNIVNTREGHAEFHRLGRDEGEDGVGAEWEEFWAALGGEQPIKGPVVREPKEQHSSGILLKETQNGFEEVSRQNLSKKSLHTKQVMLLDAGTVMFIWIGWGADEDMRKGAFKRVMSYLELKGHNMSTPITIVKEGQKVNNEVWNNLGMNV